ncbi:MAG TPA: 16S rRNA (guanine(527)-N(7))-methyltransferase RsmG [Polyangiaceae bacterium]|nr:MAG: Ribosomal RNA small subunit methyltransferase G [Deltaproteobacteria bacterium ADurb.Bin207]HNS98755.1 16S rRNA (guanine(527)-N(7))-methyltransferase RsmG [Polyangiaceae bacterium]HNZ23641.1 16S rRNA (guanine(527)-N(7))-methyltransferase RsmG [Polyangiaceae bacterium]HOD22443.1 16S rRNA (guanine(527)-N(7))-methyltransferase RsmG [Polyangiaceae bacterium]HOE47786.1 16S rRNA (guanine(527)-N(7))-methyltransferase RsmG [Polyangiaceae bacterium]
MNRRPLPPRSDTIPSRLEQLAHALETPLDPTIRLQLVQWIETILHWNQKIDLTAARTIDELLDLCVADAIVLSRSIEANRRVVDVGSGAGAPGLPLALLRPDLTVTLVEPLAKRVAFLRTVAGSLPTTVSIQRTHGENLPHHGWDVAISRATLEPSAWLAMGLHLVDSKGKVAVLLARQEISPPIDAVSEEDISYRWPLTQAQRRVRWFKRGR